ncbi:hypothetical protein MOQ_000587 [Trypanosoma cruzi marinkellei]|uniref:Uncharacterized protein n=1 Tax=Trypanosoma cruzi marinkellei TaxID=85056 RepID=K2NN43_TRYCR|nr:hypothetical protein MOQ_000587 [Trypanosoma cruzi marinkellei]
MTTGFLREAVISVTVWSAGDFLAQFYHAHREAAQRRLERGEKRKGERPSAGQMAAMLDKPRVGLSAAFGLAISPFVVQYRRLCIRSLGQTERRMLAAFMTLSAQQFFMTPLTLLVYHNAITACRGGFTYPSFLRAHETSAHTGGRYDAMAVERRILSDLMPLTLVSSWFVYLPLSLLAYASTRHARGICAAACLIPWTAYVSHIQSTLML